MLTVKVRRCRVLAECDNRVRVGLCFCVSRRRGLSRISLPCRSDYVSTFRGDECRSAMWLPCRRRTTFLRLATTTFGARPRLVVVGRRRLGAGASWIRPSIASTMHSQRLRYSAREAAEATVSVRIRTSPQVVQPAPSLLSGARRRDSAHEDTSLARKAPPHRARHACSEHRRAQRVDSSPHRRLICALHFPPPGAGVRPLA